MKKWKVVFQINVPKINPETASKNKIKRKQELKKAISKKIESIQDVIVVSKPTHMKN